MDKETQKIYKRFILGPFWDFIFEPFFILKKVFLLNIKGQSHSFKKAAWSKNFMSKRQTWTKLLFKTPGGGEGVPAVPRHPRTFWDPRFLPRVGTNRVFLGVCIKTCAGHMGLFLTPPGGPGGAKAPTPHSPRGGGFQKLKRSLTWTCKQIFEFFLTMVN